MAKAVVLNYWIIPYGCSNKKRLPFIPYLPKIKHLTMIKYLFTVLNITLTVFWASAQSNFIKAIVINKSGDSISGNLDYRNWKSNPQYISFINSAGEKQRFDAAAIGGFYIPSVNETYTSYTVTMDMLPGDQDEALKNTAVDSPLLTRTVFLLQLIKHPSARLYQFSGNHKEHFFYAAGNDAPIELLHHYTYDEGAGKVVSNDTYKEQLSGFFSSCEPVANKARTTKFSGKDIQGILLAYLQCSAPGTVADIKKKDSVSIKFGIVAGAMINSFEFIGPDSQLADANYSGNTSPVLGVSLDMGLSRNRNSWHIVNEIIYKSYKTSSRFTKPYGNGYTVSSDVQLQFSYAQLNTLLRYVFQSKKSIKPFLEAGIANAFMVAQHKNTWHNVYSFASEETLKAFDGPATYEFLLQGGAGISYRRTSFECRYSANKKGFSPYHTLDTNPTSIQALFTYQF